MRRGVIFLLTGSAHAVRAVVSMCSLRRPYDGPVTLYTTQPTSSEIGHRCTEDERLKIDHVVIPQVPIAKNSSFLTKVELLPASPYDVTLYLDADTLVTGPVEELFVAAEESGFAATQFANWVSSGKTIRKRIEAWRNIEADEQTASRLKDLVDSAIVARPAVNGGVFAFRRDSSLLGPWRELAYLGWQTFICDEIALQLLLHHHPHAVLDCRFNCSPFFASDQRDVRIWHFHGERHVTNPRSRQLWWPSYCACLLDGIAGLHQWSPGGDPRLRAYLNSRSHHAST